MIVKNPKFEVSALSKAQYPKNDLPQIVLVGKSNVGKSSFINTMVNRKSLARTSSEPGKTRQLNFYNIDNAFYFVDLPGYGYSKMSKAEQVKVNEAIEEYLFNGKNISLIVFLIDIRHKPGTNDRVMFDYILNTNTPFLVVANKADKIAVTKVNSYIEDIKKELNISSDIVIPFSSQRKVYTENVWDFIYSIMPITFDKCKK